MDADNACDHEGCNCATASGSDYCSPHCEAASEGEVTEIRCECGHPGCASV